MLTYRSKKMCAEKFGVRSGEIKRGILEQNCRFCIEKPAKLVFLKSHGNMVGKKIRVATGIKNVGFA